MLLLRQNPTIPSLLRSRIAGTPAASAAVPFFRGGSRFQSTLADNPDIYVFPTSTPNTHLLTLIPSADASYSLGTTTALPPTPRSFTENASFLRTHLHPILARIVPDDPIVQSDALAFCSSSVSFSAPKPTPSTKSRSTTKSHSPLHTSSSGGSGGANLQGGYHAGGGVGGWLHVYDMRGVPAFGRIADTEDILGSVLVDAEGKVVRGQWEPNGMYRIVTGRGVMRLSEFLGGRVREELAAKAKEGR